MANRQHMLIGVIILSSIIFFIFAMALLISSLNKGSNSIASSGGDKVAIVKVEGVIYGSESIVDQLDKYKRDKSVKAIVLRVNSPGGGIAPSQEMYEKVKEVRDSGKPVVASMGSVAASGGYYVSCGADTIMANPGTTTGSIGVIAEIPNTQKLMDLIGIKYEVIKSGKYKDTGSPHREMTPDERAYLQGWINDAYEQFVDVVANERKLDRQTVKKYADGRVYTGKQALKIGLIDTLGTYEDAIHLAAKIGGIDEENPKTIQDRRRKLTIWDVLFQDVSKLADLIQRWPRMKYQLAY
ncbi:signal peptide peptidase SppA [candidate division KSB1 bacterium]|nr:signal peptide peptidase SppA [candidate division KSB1 bacterium]